jgi:hypothetical protein
MISHVLAVTALVGTGLFASVLAPPAATGIIKDLTIRAGSSSYVPLPPAQRLWQQLFPGVTGPSPSSTAAAAAVAAVSSTAPTATASYSTNASVPPPPLTTTTVVPSGASNIIARANYNQSAKPAAMNRGLANTTRIATSIHKY